jgi:crotonobetainyl-CoA:carnitine CoA-transferase CaiB-like acyl-CoA transferase
MSNHSWQLRPAPRLGDCTDAVLAALTGVRILDLSRVWAGPLATRILADLGADVIRVEAIGGHGVRVVPDAVIERSRRYPNNQAGERPWNREGMYNKFNRNKRAITLQLNTPQGKAAFEQLVTTSDIVIENYSPRVMPQLGLGYERLRELNPGIIYIGMPGYGWSGPARDWVAYGTTLEPGAGLSSLMGYPDSGPYKSGVAWADPVAGLNAAAALLVALWDRRADPAGQGQAIELAQLEGMVSFAADEILAAQARGHNRPRLGNRHPFYVPQGCYPCRGDDRWIAISVTDDAAWHALCAEASFDAACAAMRLDQRSDAHDALDVAIAAWTARHDQIDLMHRLQARGVAACAVLDARGLVEDPHLAARGFFVTITHPDAGTYPFPGQPIHLSETPATFRRPAPGLGQHNREVLGGILGMTDAQMDELHAAGIIADEPPL